MLQAPCHRLAPRGGAGTPQALWGCRSGPTQEALPRTRSGDSVTLGRLEMPPRGVRSTSRDRNRYWHRAHLWIQALEEGSGRTWALRALGHRGFPHTSAAECKHLLAPASQPCHHARSAHAYLSQDRPVSQRNTHACEGAPLRGDPRQGLEGAKQPRGTGNDALRAPVATATAAVRAERDVSERETVGERAGKYSELLR